MPGEPFPQLVEGSKFTHRRSTVNVGNPALILHRAYRIPAGEVDAAWRKAIVEFATKVQENLCRISHNATSRDSFRPDTLELQRHCTFRAELNPGSECRVGISFSIDILDEIWTWKLFVDFSRCTKPEYLKGDYATLFKALDDIENLIRTRVESSTIVISKGTYSLKRKATSDDIEAQLDILRDSLQGAIDNVESSIVPRDVISAMDNATPAQQVPCNDGQDGFGDFVGLSLAVPAYIEDDNQGCPKRFKINPEKRLDRKKFDNVFDNIRSELYVPRSSPRLMQLVDSIWPVAVKLILKRSPDEKTPTPERRPTEFAISRMNRGRALHVTSLGSGFDARASSEHPLVYLLLCPHNATWQIGRMVDRIHYLAIFRAAAIFEHEAIDKANDRMRRLIDRIEQNEEVSIVRAEFDSIRRIERARNKGVEGLHYRMEWSRYYLAYYRKLLAGTDFSRVEGYQTYEEFINRRLGLFFELIDTSARRFQYVSKLLSEKESQRTSENSRDLLRGAEVISIIPVSYYLHGVIDRLNGIFLRYFGQLFDVMLTDVWFLGVIIYIALIIWLGHRRKRVGRRKLAKLQTSPTLSQPSPTSAPPAPVRRPARDRA